MLLTGKAAEEFIKEADDVERQYRDYLKEKEDDDNLLAPEISRLRYTPAGDIIYGLWEWEYSWSEWSQRLIETYRNEEDAVEAWRKRIKEESVPYDFEKGKGRDFLVKEIALK